MGETDENNVANHEKEEKHADNENRQGEDNGEKVKDKKKKKEKKEKNPEDKNDPAKLKAKLEKIDSKIQALNIRREEILKLIVEAQANAPAPEAGAHA